MEHIITQNRLKSLPKRKFLKNFRRLTAAYWVSVLYAHFLSRKPEAPHKGGASCAKWKIMGLNAEARRDAVGIARNVVVDAAAGGDTYETDGTTRVGRTQPPHSGCATEFFDFVRSCRVL